MALKEELNDLTAPAYQSRLFHHVGSWERLEPLGEHIYLPENRCVAMPGDVCRFCYLVMEGQVISQEMTEDGNEHIFNLFEQGSIFLESNVLAGFHVDIHFITTRPTELVRICPDVLKKAMREDPLIADTVFLSNASKYYSAMDQLRECCNHSAIWKIYNMFVLLAESAGKPYAGGLDHDRHENHPAVYQQHAGHQPHHCQLRPEGAAGVRADFVHQQRLLLRPRAGERHVSYGIRQRGPRPTDAGLFD